MPHSGVPWVPVPMSGGWECAGSPQVCLGSELWAVPGDRGQSRFSGTGWAGRSAGWRIMERGGDGGGKPQSDVSFTVALRSPPGGVQLPLRAPGGVCGVTTGELLPPAPMAPAVVLLVLPLCCPAWLQPTPSCLLWPAPVASLDLALAVHITSSLLYLLPSVLVSPGEVAVGVAGSKKLLGGKRKRKRWQRVLLKFPCVSGSVLDSGIDLCVVGRCLSVCSACF